MHLLWDRKDYFVGVGPCIFHFSPIRLYVTLGYTQEVFCYISVVLTEHLLENFQVLYSFKVLYVSSFKIEKVENDPYLQEWSQSIITW